MSAPFPCHPIPAVAAEMDADAALTARAQKLSIGLADTMPCPVSDKYPMKAAALMPPALAQRLATPETAERDAQRMEDALRSIYGALRGSSDPLMHMVAHIAARGLGDDTMRAMNGRP